MKKVFPIFLLSVIILCSQSQNGWQRMSFSYNTNIADVQFVNENTGYIAAGRNFSPGSVFKSFNGGLSWELICRTNKPLRALYFSSANTGTVVGMQTNLRRTYSGGNIWLWFAPPMSHNSVNAVHFIGDKTGWVAGDSGYVFRTYDYGANWMNISPGFKDITWSDIYFMNLNTGIAAGESNLRSPIMRTTNAGNNWIEITGFNGAWKRISFCNEQTGFIAGSANFTGLIKTTNGGINWFISGNAGEYNDVYCVNEYITFAVGVNGTIHKSTNGGDEWEELNSGTSESLYGVYFINSLTGLVCGDNGVILKTTTGGINPIGIHNTGTEIPEKFSLEQNYPNPFNPNTVISFQLAVNSFVQINIYDILGNEIVILVNEKLNPGTYEVTWDASNYPSGTYFYRIEAGDYTETKKMVLVK